MNNKSRIQQISDAVEASILPGGLLILSVTEATESVITATVGKIGQVGEWHGDGRTAEEAIRAAATAALRDDS